MRHNSGSKFDNEVITIKLDIVKVKIFETSTIALSFSISVRGWSMKSSLNLSRPFYWIMEIIFEKTIWVHCLILITVILSLYFRVFWFCVKMLIYKFQAASFWLHKNFIRNKALIIVKHFRILLNLNFTKEVN